MATMIAGTIKEITSSNKPAKGSTVPLVINGKEIITETTFDVISPSTGKLLHKSSSASVENANDAVRAARDAFPSWAATPPLQRRNILLKAADIMESRKDELVEYMMEETGSDEFYAAGFNVPLGADNFREAASKISSISGSVPNLSSTETSAMVLMEPYGVILAIAPWNAPYILGVRSIAFALAAGNTAILKGPEFSPRCFWALSSVLSEAGLPTGVLNLLYHKPSDAALITKTLIENPSIKKVNFTGSTPVGRIIGSLCGQNLKPVILELGGKAPAIVWKDADLKKAAQHCAVGAFLHAGQICMSTERIIVHEDVCEEFAKELKGAAEKIFSGASVLINSVNVNKNKALVEDATSKGATIISGSLDDSTNDPDTRLKPIIISGVKPGMNIYHTESFGPTVSLFTVSTEEEALKIANDTEYGLSSAVFTEDLRTGLRFAKGIESGAVHINDMSVHDETALPHGGVKASGFGRFGSIGMGEWVRSKTITFKN